jgi:ABC-type phosphate/phosphonate transport system substrate-binding protein
MAGSAPIAALAMYDWPEVAAANDAIWHFLRQHLAAHRIVAPAQLTRGASYSAPWRSPDLLLAQACGFPYATQLSEVVQLVATPAYHVEGCQGTDYCSSIVANCNTSIYSLDDLGTATAAINSQDSQSGYWALRAAIASEPSARPPRRAVLTGGHRESLTLVAGGRADVAAIDAVCWALAKRYEPDAVAMTRVIGQSPSAPGLPLISAGTTKPEVLAALRSGLQAALQEPGLANARSALNLSGIEVLQPAAYGRIRDLQRLAMTRPFPATADLASPAGDLNVGLAVEKFGDKGEPFA